MQKATQLLTGRCLVLGLGIVDHPGIVAYVADHLLAACKATTIIVLALVEEHIGKKHYRDLVASGRSTDALAPQLPGIFGDAFSIENNGKRISRGGGKITGKLASCAASIPLPEKGDALALWQEEGKKIKKEFGKWITQESMVFHDRKTAF